MTTSLLHGWFVPAGRHDSLPPSGWLTRANPDRYVHHRVHRLLHAPP